MKSKQLLNVLSEVDEKYIEESSPVHKSVKAKKPIWVKFGAIAACLAIFVLSAVMLPGILNNPATDPIEQITATGDSPNGMRKFINYNNHRYAFLENGATYNLSSEQIGAVLGTLEHDIQKNPEANAKKDFAATFAIGGTVYQLSGYDPLFRLAVEHDGNYYICERVDTVDDTQMNIAEYFELALFPKTIKEINIRDHMGTNILKTLPGNKVSLFVESLSTVVPASLANEDYANISAAQKSGESFLVYFELKDSTQYKIYVLPTLSLAIIGDNKYTLSGEFMAEFEDLFEELAQKPVPMQ